MKLEGIKRCVSKRCGRIIDAEAEHYYEFDKPYLLVLLKAKVHPKLITEEAAEAFEHQFHYMYYRYDQLRLLKAGIIHLFSTLRQAAEIRRDFEAYDDYMARESTFVTLVNRELKRREGSK